MNLVSTDRPQSLDTLRFPLQGSRLIEASAGTGKTYTIATLYVRLVLGHGGDAAFARPLTPPDILVVTFTEAATQELRDRIRKRLAEAAAFFLEGPAQQTDGVPDDEDVDEAFYEADDDFPDAAYDAAQDDPDQRASPVDVLHTLREQYPTQDWAACARKLQLAAEWMDEAAVSTIHSWCNRMLREHAFDSNSLFTQVLETDQDELLADVMRDYWRNFHYPLPPDDVHELLQWWQDPSALLTQVRALLGHVAHLPPGEPPAQAIPAARAVRDATLAAFKEPWLDWADEMETLLDEAVARKAVDGRKLQRRYYQPWLESLRAWAQDPKARDLDLKTGWERLTPTGLADIWKTGAPPEHPAWQAIAELRPALASLPDARTTLLAFATHWVSQRFALEQERRAQMGFNDLLTRLDAALQGPNGTRLADVIRTQFPVAMIDEFQDTDPVQYRIFDTVYRVVDNDPDTALILIGDPKQAIYAFRGADIHTYLRARRATDGRHYTLDTNFRSTQGMVAAVNRCFAQAEQREAGAGAFLFRDTDENPVPFLEVQARGQHTTLRIDGAPAPALTCWYLDSDKPMKNGDYRNTLAQVCATEVTRLLTGGQTGDVTLGPAPDDTYDVAQTGNPPPARGLRPRDIAILVNSGTEAAAVRAALAQRGVRSVYLSDKESVFQSAQAAELALWLAACAEPDDDRLLRAALATATLGLDWAALDHLNRDELAWEARVMQFRGYRTCWQQQGVLPMLRRLLGDFTVPHRLLRSADGERALTDLLHLAELLQQASGALDGEHALLRYLAEAREGMGGDSDARKLRLESDADLVQVVTVHKSKGLEYPLVFLPFGVSFRARKRDDLPLAWHDGTGELHLTLQANDEALAQADRERLGEDVRKLYVALTRARYATWVGLAPLVDVAHSAAGYLLAGGEPIAPEALAPALTALQGPCHDIAVMPAPSSDDLRFVARDDTMLPGPARVPVAPVSEHWWIASYSGLRLGDTDPEAEEARPRGAPALADTAAQDTYEETRNEPATLTSARPVHAQEASLHRFPRGPNPGSFLHGLLEWAARTGFARVLAEPALARDVIARRCNLRGWNQWIEPLCAWLPLLLSQPLVLPGVSGHTVSPLRLGDLTGYQVEMEFWIGVEHMQATHLNAQVVAHTLQAAPRQPLLPARLNGMLKGFIDLVFEHEGRYYVADYKSNWLGSDDAAYTGAALRDEVLAKRYDLQYVLYVFALHRLLRARLPDYDYDQHMGGAVYLFLRGGQSATQGLHCERPPAALMEALDALFQGARVANPDDDEEAA